MCATLSLNVDYIGFKSFKCDLLAAFKECSWFNKMYALLICLQISAFEIKEHHKFWKPFRYLEFSPLWILFIFEKIKKISSMFSSHSGISLLSMQLFIHKWKE